MQSQDSSQTLPKERSPPVKLELASQIQDDTTDLEAVGLFVSPGLEPGFQPSLPNESNNRVFQEEALDLRSEDLLIKEEQYTDDNISGDISPSEDSPTSALKTPKFFTYQELASRDSLESEQNESSVEESSTNPEGSSRLNKRSRSSTNDNEDLEIPAKRQMQYSVSSVDNSLVEKLSTFVDQVQSLIEEALSCESPIMEIDHKVKDIRKTLHDMPFWEGISENLIRESDILSDDKLGLLYNDTANVFPSDMQEFAQELHNRWSAGIYSPNIYFGTSRKTPRSQRTLDREIFDWMSSAYVGQGNLVNGQWWPSRALAMRDGAHGSYMSGIYGLKPSGHGAFSIVISTGGYEDIDDGETIQVAPRKYCPSLANRSSIVETGLDVAVLG
jgi:hypothetical protein